MCESFQRSRTDTAVYKMWYFCKKQFSKSAKVVHVLAV